MEKSIKSLIAFLNAASDSKQLKFHTARTRKTAIRILLNVLTAQEKNDILKIDFNTLEKRFRSYEEGNNVSEPIKASSLKTYITRLKSSVVDFQKWIKSPANFKPTHTKRSKENLNFSEIGNPINNEEVNLIKSLSPIYISIRESLIEIKNVPSDLNIDEVGVICDALKQYSERNYK